MPDPKYRVDRLTLMSALGQSRRLRHVWGMSAYPPIATDARTFQIGSSVRRVVGIEDCLAQVDGALDSLHVAGT